jgi:hypothetical protein
MAKICEFIAKGFAQRETLGEVLAAGLETGRAAICWWNKIEE